MQQEKSEKIKSLIVERLGAEDDKLKMILKKKDKGVNFDITKLMQERTKGIQALAGLHKLWRANQFHLINW